MFSAILVGCENDPSRLLVKQMKAVLADVEDYSYGKSRSWLQNYDSLMAVVYNKPETHVQVQELMLKLLKSNAAPEAKLIICQSIGTFGNAESIPALIDIMEDPATRHMALMALSTMPDEKVDVELIAMLNELDAETQLAIINVLGQKKSISAIELLETFLDREDGKLRKASIEALAKIGGRRLLTILEDRFESEELDAKWQIADAILKILSSQEIEDDQGLTQNIYTSNPPLSIQFNAFLLILESMSVKDQVDLMLAELRSATPEMQQALVPLIRHLDPSADIKPIIDGFQSFSASIQMQLMLAIADRKDEGIRPLALSWLKASDIAKRKTALKAMKLISDSRDIVRLARMAANTSGKEQELARKCLYWMEDAKSDQTILDAISNADGALKAELIQCVGYRKIVTGRTEVLKNLDDPNNQVRKEAIIAMGKIGNEDDFEALVEWTERHSKSDDAANITTTLINLALLSANQESIVSQLGQKLQGSPGEVPTCIFIDVLGGIRGEKCFSIIKPYVEASSEKIQFAALKVLANWDSDLPLSTLKQQIQANMTAKNHSQALAGVVYLVQYSRNLSSNQKAEELKDAFGYANSDFDKKMIIRGFSRITNEQALEFCISHIDDESIKEDAQNAVVEIAGNLRYSEPALAKEAVDELLQKKLEPQFEARLKILRKSLSL